MKKQFTIKNRYRAFASGFSAFAVALLSSLLAASFLAPVSLTDATTETTTTGNNHTITLTMNDTLSLDITSTPDGAFASTTDNLSITSDAPNGYQLYISMSGTDTNLVNSTDDSNYYSPTSGTFASPAVLSMNSWGYAIPSGTTGAPDSIAFDSSYDSATSSSTFAAVPALADAQLLQQTSEPNTTANTVDITYAVQSNTAQAAGAYTGTITYTILADDPAPSIYMQDFTLAMCDALATDEQLTLIDSRDDKTYTVVKAKDGNCWMADNLKYAVTTSSSWTTNDYSQNLLHIATNEGYEGEYYYNHPAALEACPTGWTLPVNGDSSTDKSFAKLLGSYSITTGAELLSNTRLGFDDYYGNWDWAQGKEWYQGEIGFFRTATSTETTTARTFGYNSAVVSPQDDYSKGSGFSVRCVFDHNPDLDTMQSFTFELCENLAEDSSRTLIDDRDQKSYTITRAKDGNCWMTSNLKYDIASSTSWSTNNYTDKLLHIATSSGYEGEYYYNYPAALEACPAGWTLPTNGDSSTDKSWAKLLAAYEITTGAELLENDVLNATKYYGDWSWYNAAELLENDVLNATKYYGDWSWYNAAEHSKGVSGFFWSSTPTETADLAYVLAFYESGLDAQHSDGKANGFTARCVFDSAGTMQEFTLDDCANLAVGTTILLEDRRDGNKYHVLKAKDGNCWMTDNLALTDTTISAEDSNFSKGTFDVPASSTWSTNVTDSAKVHVATNSGYAGEVYYNWYAATAGSTESLAGKTVNISICPKGWRLPINGDSSTDKSWAKLMNKYSITTGAALLSNDDLGFTQYYGNWAYDSGQESAQGTNAGFWAATPISSANARGLAYSSTVIDAQMNRAKGYGFSIRCVFEDSRTLEDITYMQDVNASICQNTAEGYATTLLDKRGRGSGGSDKSTGYGVIKAKDGNCWMSDNLDLYDISLSSTTSDTSGSFTLPASSTWSSNIYNAAKLHVATKSGYEGEVYYNWCSAVALTDCSTTTEQNQSICPKNWRLPVNGEYGTLFDAYSVTNGVELVAVTELNFNYRGLWHQEYSSEWGQGLEGYLWASTPYTAERAWSVYYNNFGSRYDQSHPVKDNGNSIRCLAR